MSEPIISDPYVVQRLRDIADLLESGQARLVTYTAGEACNSAVVSSHSLTIGWHRDSQTTIADAAKKEVPAETNG